MNTHHLNWVQLAMKFGEKNTKMTLFFDLQHWLLVNEVFLLWEQTSHATVLTLKWTDQQALGSQLSNLESMLLKNSLQTFSLAWQSGHLLDLSTKLGIGVCLRIMVSHCLHCFLKFDLFISKAQSASRGKEAWADDWSKIKRAWQSGWAASKISITAAI